MVVILPLVTLGKRAVEKARGQLTPQGEFLLRLLKGETKKAERISELEKLAKGVGIATAIGAAPLLVVKAPLAAALAAPLLIGLAATAPGREFIAAGIDPVRRFKLGKELGEFIGKPPAEKEAGAVDILKKVGLGAGLVGAGVAAAAVAPTIIERVKEVFRKEAPVSLAAAPLATLPSQVVPSFEIIPGEVKPEPVKEEIVPVAKVPDIKINVKPEINVRVSQSRRFINQQILIK